MYTFDGTNREIILDSGVTEVSNADMFSRWKDWTLTSDNAKYPKAFVPIGGDDLGGGLRVPSYYFLANGWKVRTHGDGTQVIFSLNLYVEGGGDPFIAVGSDKIVNKVSDIPGIDALGLTIEEKARLLNIETLTSSIDTMTKWLERWHKADEIKTPTRYERRDVDDNSVILGKNYTSNGSGNESLTE